jgi:hypothetical protein
MKRLFYASAAILMLSLAFHSGYSTARAQAPGNPVVGIAASTSGFVAATANGDTYSYGNGGPAVWHPLGNVFGSGPTPAMQESWGQLNSRYAPSHAPTSQTPTIR